MGHSFNPTDLLPMRPGRLRLDDVQEWEASQEGKANFRKRVVRLGTFVLAPDGSFEIDDLAPGDYKLRISYAEPKPVRVRDDAPDVI